MTNLPALPPIQVTKREIVDETMLYRVARAHASRYHESNPAALIGGTALKLVLGITRSTTDLDFVRREPGRQIAVNEVAPLLEALGTKVTNVTQDPNGRTTLIEYKAGIWRRRRLKIDEIAPRTVELGKPIKRNGITTYEERTLVALKLEAVLSQKAQIGRAKARDLYDCAWIARNRPELLSAHHLKGLLAITAEEEDGERMRRWREDFNNDPIMKRADMKTVLKVLKTCVEAEKTRCSQIHGGTPVGQGGAGTNP